MRSLPSVDVPRLEPVDFQPWDPPEGASRLTLLEATRGGAPRLRTEVSLFHDGLQLHALFRMEDDEQPRGSMLVRDDPIYREDVLEIFLSPTSLTEYFEIEINPLGTWFDARVESPDGVRATMKVDPSWDCEGLLGLIRRQREGRGLWTVDTLVSIPFAGLGGAPASGDVWHANLFRIDRQRTEHDDEYSAWSPTLETPPNFHVPGSFGSLRFA